MEHNCNPFIEEVLVEYEGELRKLQIHEGAEDPFSIDDQNSEAASIHEVLSLYGSRFWYSLQDHREDKAQSLFERIKHFVWCDPDTKEAIYEDLSDLEVRN